MTRLQLHGLMTLVFGLAVSQPAWADGGATTPATGASLARADDLFRAGKAAMTEKDFPRACRAFEDSLKLDDALGTRLNLALCNEQRGHLVAAWGLFKDVQGRAELQGERQADKAKLAGEHASALEPRLAHVRIVVLPSVTVQGIEVTVDGEPAPPDLWALGVAADVGSHAVVATAPGKSPFRTTVRVEDEGQVVWAQILGFVDAPIVPVKPPVKEVDSAAQSALVLRQAESFANARTERTLGWVVGGTGLAATALGLTFGALALSNVSDANACTTVNPCDLHVAEPQHAADRARIDASEAARSRTHDYATAANIAIPIGLALTAVGGYFLVRSLSHAAPPAKAAQGIRFTSNGVEF